MSRPSTTGGECPTAGRSPTTALTAMLSAFGDRALMGARVLRHAGTSYKTRERVRHRRSPLVAVLHAPQVLRALVRADEIWLVALAAFVGACTGVIVYFITAAAQFL